jgi:hypothetical protein
MANDKMITVTVAGSGQSFEVPVSPGDEPSDVLWQVVDDEDEYSLRTGENETIGPGTDVHEAVDNGEVMFAATEPVVG